MPAATKKSRKPEKTEDAVRQISAVRGLVLARIACAGGATRAQIVRDLGPMVSHKLSPAEWREMVGVETLALLTDGLCDEARGKLSPTDTGIARAEEFLGSKNTKTVPSWPDLRDGRIVAKALDIDRIGPTVLKALARPDGLRAVILQKAFGLKARDGQSPSNLRCSLALVALERAFGNKIKAGLGAGAASGLSAKAGRLLAGQLSVKPRDFGTDVRLVTSLAAEAVDARQSDADALKTAILRGFVTRGLAKAPPAQPTPSKPVQAANDKGLPGAAPHAIRRPGPEEFARLVEDASSTCATGWAGNRKALISHVWAVIEQHHPGWALSAIEFKCMLAEAHRSGLLMLASADLKSKDSIKDLELSAITYKNTIWHLIRVPADDS